MRSSVLLQLIVSGLTTGLVYALVSTGLTLIWGLMNLVNFAHGEYLMVAMFSAYWFSTLYHWDPLVSFPLTVIAVTFLSGATYYLLIRRHLSYGPAMANESPNGAFCKGASTRGDVFGRCGETRRTTRDLM